MSCITRKIRYPYEPYVSKTLAWHNPCWIGDGNLDFICPASLKSACCCKIYIGWTTGESWWTDGALCQSQYKSASRRHQRYIQSPRNWPAEYTRSPEFQICSPLCNHTAVLLHTPRHLPSGPVYQPWFQEAKARCQMDTLLNYSLWMKIPVRQSDHLKTMKSSI